MGLSKSNLPIGRSICLWTNKTNSVYTAKITIFNPKPLPANVQYWAGVLVDRVTDKPNVKIPAKQDVKEIEISVSPGESLCLFTENRDIVVEYELFVVHVSHTHVDMSEKREATVRVSVGGAKSPILVGPSSVAKGLTVTPQEVLVKPLEETVFKIKASEATNSLRKVKFGILDRASASKTVVADCRKMIRATYQEAKENTNAEQSNHGQLQSKLNSQQSDIIAGMRDSYFKNHPSFAKK